MYAGMPRSSIPPVKAAPVLLMSAQQTDAGAEFAPQTLGFRWKAKRA
jgi:hypothetical protein